MRDHGELHVFVAATTTDADALARLLGPFAVIQAGPLTVDFRLLASGGHARIGVSGLSQPTAERLLRRLAQLPCVRSVELAARAQRGLAPAAA